MIPSTDRPSATVGTDLWRLGATELAEAIRSRQVSSRETIEAHLRRIEEVDPAVNAVTIVLGESAFEAADVADAAVAAGADLPALHGVPFTVKGNIDVVGSPTTQGLRALEGAYPSLDAPTVARLRAAGAIPIGRTNCATITVRWHTESELWGSTINPWNAGLTPGASSGGEAAAIATGMSPLGLGNDTLGSLRWPAQCCGVATLKPTIGRIPHASTFEPDASIGVQLAGVQGPMARHLADLRVALEVLAGPTWRDPWSVPAPLRGAPPPVPIRVAVVTDPGGHGTAPQVGEGVRKASAALADAGYAIDEVEPPSIDEAAAALLDMLNTPDIRAMADETRGMVPEVTDRFLTSFYAVRSSDVLTVARSFAVRQSILRAWAEFQEGHPLIVAPVSTEPPFHPGDDVEAARVAETIRAMRMTLAVNALGLPAVAVPVGIGAGLPQVVQIIGPRYREDLCLDAADAVERRLGTITPIDPR